ncbi:MAG: hypothetical protein FWE82_09640, partial [Defluviitaleaceae bacterium]|nr:hypothetical protein [Defluviitaleaceae bacterium]
MKKRVKHLFYAFLISVCVTMLFVANVTATAPFHNMPGGGVCNSTPREYRHYYLLSNYAVETHQLYINNTYVICGKTFSQYDHLGRCASCKAVCG